MSQEVYECEGCDAVFIGTFEEAFDLGWDTPERFMSHCTCPNCTIDKTAWWKLTVEKVDLTPDEIARIQHYNRLYAAANPEVQM